MRDVTVSQFMQRYHVDSKQARRVASLALALYRRFTAGAEDIDEAAPHYIAWAAKLHEIGISVAYSGYHKHSAYIVQNADMPGFSKMEQWRLATLVLAHRRTLKKIFTRDVEIVDWRMVMALRLAALIYRSRADIALPEIDAKVNGPHAAAGHRPRVARQQPADGHRAAGRNRGMGRRPASSSTSNRCASLKRASKRRPHNRGVSVASATSRTAPRRGSPSSCAADSACPRAACRRSSRA